MFKSVTAMNRMFSYMDTVRAVILRDHYTAWARAEFEAVFRLGGEDYIRNGMSRIVSRAMISAIDELVDAIDKDTKFGTRDPLSLVKIFNHGYPTVEFAPDVRYGVHIDISAAWESVRSSHLCLSRESFHRLQFLWDKYAWFVVAAKMAGCSVESINVGDKFNDAIHQKVARRRTSETDTISEVIIPCIRTSSGALLYKAIVACEDIIQLDKEPEPRMSSVENTYYSHIC